MNAARGCPSGSQAGAVPSLNDCSSGLREARVGKYVIIEGSAGALIRDDFRAYFDLTVWIDVPADIAHARGKTRDRVEQGVDHDHLWDEVWSPLENAWFDEHRPDLKVDVLLSNDGPP